MYNIEPKLYNNCFIHSYGYGVFHYNSINSINTNLDEYLCNSRSKILFDVYAI